MTQALAVQVQVICHAVTIVLVLGSLALSLHDMDQIIRLNYDGPLWSLAIATKSLGLPRDHGEITNILDQTSIADVDPSTNCSGTSTTPGLRETRALSSVLVGIPVLLSTCSTIRLAIPKFARMHGVQNHIV